MRNPWVIVAGLVIFVASLAAFIVLSILKLDTSGLVAFIGVAATTGGFAAWHNTELIKKQTNGPLENINKRVTLLEEAAANTNELLADISTRLESKGV